MGLFSNLFSAKNKSSDAVDKIYVDMHSHLLPGIDDGAKDLEQSVIMIGEFAKLGYKKLITTPHIMGDFYKNTPEIINNKLAIVKDAVAKAGIEIELQAAAEYYLDESFIQKLKNGQQMLTFGENYLLFETSYLNEPSNLFQAIQLIKDSGYWPVLAHPERYQYLYASIEKFEAIFEQSLSFQLNTNSLSGYYSKPAQHFALKLIEKNMVNFIGSDCHSIKHLDVLKKTISSKEYQKLQSLFLFNNTLL